MASKLSTTVVTLQNGVKMPQFGLGVKFSHGEIAEKAIQAAFQCGYRHIDTAAIYSNEERVGEGIRYSGIPRDQIFVTTKVWNTDQGFDSVAKACDRSLRKLELNYVDLYLINWPRTRMAAGRDLYSATWWALEQLYEEKKVRAIGVSNFEPHHIEDILRICKVAPMVNQIELHPLNNQKPLRDYCASKNIVVTAWSPLGMGNLVSDPILTEIGKKHNKTAAQVILRWDIQHGIITIPKSVDEERIRENANIFDFELSAEEMDTIDAMNQNKRFGPDPEKAEF